MKLQAAERRQKFRERALKAIDAEREALLKLSHDIHTYAEIGYEEFRSSDRLRSFLADRGFRVSQVDGLPTAFVAEAGSGRPVICFMAEYDALPEIGHACGHNIIAAAAAGAAIGVKSFLGEPSGDSGGSSTRGSGEDSGRGSGGGLAGTIQVIGTPAEESGSAKIAMVEQQVFQGVDAAMIVHPADRYMADDVSLAIRTFTVGFHGKASHAASAPEHGVNALSAAVEFLVSVNAFREHMTKEGRIHAIISHGGTVVNVIPEYAEVKVAIRATTGEYLEELEEQVERRARGAALSTGCRLSVSDKSPVCREIRVNPVLSRLFEANFESLGISVKPRGDVMGSTDVGNVSHTVPTIQVYAGIGAGIATHTTEFRDASISPEGDEAAMNGARVMALTAADILADSSIPDEIRAAFQRESER